MQYDVLIRNTADELAAAVNERLVNDWQLWGGPAAVDRLFMQAMVYLKRPEPRREAFNVKTFLFAGGCTVYLANAVSAAMAGATEGRISGPTGDYFLPDLTMDQFISFCADTRNDIRIARVGNTGRRQLRKICQNHLAKQKEINNAADTIISE